MKNKLKEQAALIEALAAELKQAKQNLVESMNSYFQAIDVYKQIEKEVRHGS